MKTCEEFLEELCNHCAFQRDFQNRLGSMIKADAYEDVLHRIEQFQAEQKTPQELILELSKHMDMLIMKAIAKQKQQKQEKE